MNKKFFAALASATMAFSATGSLAVFAQDFEEETNVIPGTPAENPTTVKWNKDNFGALVDVVGGNPVATIAMTAGGTWTTPKLGDDVNVDTLKDVESIVLNAQFNGEVKGLEYFTGLTTFTAKVGTVKNTSLDFSANTALETLEVTNAAELSAITLPNADEKEAYHLTTLDLENTALTSLDLTAQKGLFPATAPVTGKETTIAVSGNKNLSDVVLPTATKKTNAYVGTLNLSANSLDSVNLNNYQISGALNLSNNHIGVLNLKNTVLPADVATNVVLTGQTFYVAADAASVNLKDYFPSINLENVTPSGTGVSLEKDEETGEDTGVLTLATSGNTTYTYATGATDADLGVQIIKANPMHRLYNPNSGEHFYTKDNTEFEALVDLGWNDEGYGWVAPLDTEANALPVYRVYNPNAGDHHYTLNENEKNILVSIGWKDEEIGWYSKGDVIVYREYNPNAKAAGAHNYTTSKAENDFLVSVGWLMEGEAWKALQ